MVQTRQQSRATANGHSADNVEASKARKNLKTTKVTRPKPKVPSATSKEVSKPTPPEQGEANPQDTHHFKIPHASSTVACTIRPAISQTNSTAMIFTHGAGGDVSTPAVANFADAFASVCTTLTTDNKNIVNTNTSPSFIICFTGSMNLKSRTAMFQTVADYCATSDAFQSTPVFGERSMGARAAVMAANAINSTSDIGRHVEKLVLVSYPLLGQNGQVRDQILLDIDETVEVLFITGSQDHMCDVEELNKIRRKMAAKSWSVIVEGASHGMEIKPKKRSKELQLDTGRFAARWAVNPSFYTASENVGTTDICEMTMDPPIAKPAQQGQATPVSSSKLAVSKKRSLPEADETVGPLPNTKKKRGAKKA